MSKQTLQANKNFRALNFVICNFIENLKLKIEN